MTWRSDLAAALARAAALERELEVIKADVQRAQLASGEQAGERLGAQLEQSEVARHKLQETLASERVVVGGLRQRIQALEAALASERSAVAAAKRALSRYQGQKVVRKAPTRRDAMWRDAALATLAPGAWLADSWDVLRDALSQRSSKAHVSGVLKASGGEPVLVHPRLAAMGFVEVRVGPGVGETLFTTHDAIVQPVRPRPPKRSRV